MYDPGPEKKNAPAELMFYEDVRRCFAHSGHLADPAAYDVQDPDSRVLYATRWVIHGEEGEPIADSAYAARENKIISNTMRACINNTSTAKGQCRT